MLKDSILNWIWLRQADSRQQQPHDSHPQTVNSHRTTRGFRAPAPDTVSCSSKIQVFCVSSLQDYCWGSSTAILWHPTAAHWQSTATSHYPETDPWYRKLFIRRLRLSCLNDVFCCQPDNYHRRELYGPQQQPHDGQGRAPDPVCYRLRFTFPISQWHVSLQDWYQ